MGNTFKAHIFKRRSVGSREEVQLKVFGEDGKPIDLGSASGGPVEPPEPVDLSQALTSAWKGNYDETQDYPAGSLVRYMSKTYLSLRAAPHTGLKPGEIVAITRFGFYQNGEKSAYVLPRDMEMVIAELEGFPGYNFSGSSRWFRIVGSPGEEFTLKTTGGSGSTMYCINHSDPTFDRVAISSPKLVPVPPDGEFIVEVTQAANTFVYYGPSGPQPVPTTPWVPFS